MHEHFNQRENVNFRNPLQFTDEGMEVHSDGGAAQAPSQERVPSPSSPLAEPSAIAECVWCFEFANYGFPTDSLLMTDAEAENTQV